MSTRKTLVKAAVPALAAVAVGAVAVVGLSGNSPSPDGKPTAKTESRSGDTPAAPAAVSDPGNPATWKLPIERYMVSKADARLVNTSRDSVIAACMKKAGFPNWVPAPDLPALGGKTETDWRYGIHDAVQAAKHGYHPDAAEQQAYDQAMMAGAVDKAGADPKVLQGCAESAGRTVPTVTRSDLVEQIKGDSFKESTKDPKVTAVFAQWSACMKTKGYSYTKPMDANDEPRFNDPHNVSDVEIATAKADVACRTQHHVEKTWFDVEVTLQTKAIKVNQAALNEVQTANKDTVRQASAVATAR
ncbi:hypothetical protein [Streptomyces melanogenes]|uniref:Secreted protein n=1 Tax=Streptomyces melanogenes TaxID=67326 RepID=A0ABZ1XV54_9ACTN|nr:hypothetical protein [Streptomyces melanogenes]